MKVIDIENEIIKRENAGTGNNLTSVTPEGERYFSTRAILDICIDAKNKDNKVDPKDK